MITLLPPCRRRKLVNLIDALSHIHLCPRDDHNPSLQPFPTSHPSNPFPLLDAPSSTVKSDMHPPSAVYQHRLLKVVLHKDAAEGLQVLHKLAWKSSNRGSLFRPESADNDPGLDGFQYESIISTVGFEVLSMADRVLITPEYKAALSDAKRWFSGGKVLPTKGEDDPLDGGDVEMGSPEEEAPEGPKEEASEEVPWPVYDPKKRRHIFIVIGTPGVGKSLFLYYILVERLRAGLPTCFQTVPGSFTFWCEDGVFEIPLGESRLARVGEAIPTDAWFLVDSSEAYPTPDGSLKNIFVCIVQAASPRADHLRWTDKASTQHFRWCIKPSPLEESLIMRKLNCPATTDEQWQKFFKTYGPSTRLLTAHANTPDDFEVELRSKLHSMQLNTVQVQSFLFDTPITNMTTDEVSHWILGMKPGSRRNISTSTFHTPTILQIVKQEYESQWARQVQLAYDLFKRNPQLSVSAGHVLEDRVHDVLVNGGCWGMVKLSDPSKGTKNNIYRTHDAAPTERLTISSTGVCIDDCGVKQSTDGLKCIWFWSINGQSQSGYYRPLSSIQRTFDAYIVDAKSKSIFMIQITLAKKHDANKGGLEDLQVNYPGFVFHYIVVAGRQEVQIDMPQKADGMWKDRWCLWADEAMLFQKIT
ncbi:hypothetical protein K435DRAFT_400571 [Dendrothele bispora CBS 962.96]|uniref:Uncharacterized protein n=1 Tax=Dendrothele bispora (strain CBS 962.96) TaxID=1314807 RepID=A0A4S8L7Q8_DENBC|nr:hypothetical protein K435DRAFT_400571 [Dendrothele bispora CBS 962.96]